MIYELIPLQMKTIDSRHNAAERYIFCLLSSFCGRFVNETRQLLPSLDVVYRSSILPVLNPLCSWQEYEAKKDQETRKESLHVFRSWNSDFNAVFPVTGLEFKIKRQN